MFLHLGGDIVIPKKDIIMILDVQTKNSHITKEFLQISKDEGFLKVVSYKEKSIVITTKDIYLSPISCSTLKKRSENVLTSVVEETNRGE